MKVTEKGGFISRLLADIQLPKMFHAEQSFVRDSIPSTDIPKIVEQELSREPFKGKIKPGMRIAITAGSRGLANIVVILKSIADFVKSQGATPFIVPAMGSHGGATGPGQKEILYGYGITEESIGCEILSSMDTVFLGVSESGRPVYIDKNAYNADGIIVSCRIKPHNAFRGKVESGICKMMTVGLGKQKGASNVHADGLGRMAINIPSMAQVVLEKAPILFAIPCIENAYDETCKIEAVDAKDILKREPELLKYAFSKMPSILVKEADVLVVDEIGKNFGGNGVDPNIAGTFSTHYASGGLKVQRTCFFDLTDVSHGNANGIGLSDVITMRLFDKIDMNTLYPNAITSTVLYPARMPVVVCTDKEAIQCCIRITNQISKDPDKIRIVRIKNTSSIGQIMLSESYYNDVINGKYENVKALDQPAPLEFTEEGAIVTPVY